MTLACPAANATGFQMSETDMAILELLRQDARIPTAEIARQVGLARTTVQTKIERFKDIGVIDGFSVITGTALRAQEVSAMVMVRTSPDKRESWAAKCLGAPGVRRLLATCGAFCYIVDIAAPTLDALNTRIDALSAFDGVERTESHIILQQSDPRSQQARSA